MGVKEIRVLLIDDDPMVQDINKQFVENVEHFTVVGVANNGIEGMSRLNELKPDLVLLDIFMPIQDGVKTMTEIRRQFNVDVMVITADNDMKTIQWFLQKGAVDYIIKPFKFERLKKSLENYLVFKRSSIEGRKVSQVELDELLFGKPFIESQSPAKKADPYLPTGISEITLKRILNYLGEQDKYVSAEEVAAGTKVTRVTARRYLEYLQEKGEVKLDIRYGEIGRPVNRYRMNN